jgi:hypothetical protein
MAFHSAHHTRRNHWWLTWWLEGQYVYQQTGGSTE